MCKFRQTKKKQKTKKTKYTIVWSFVRSSHMNFTKFTNGKQVSCSSICTHTNIRRQSCWILTVRDAETKTRQRNAKIKHVLVRMHKTKRICGLFSLKSVDFVAHTHTHGMINDGENFGVDTRNEFFDNHFDKHLLLLFVKRIYSTGNSCEREREEYRFVKLWRSAWCVCCVRPKFQMQHVLDVWFLWFLKFSSMH